MLDIQLDFKSSLLDIDIFIRTYVVNYTVSSLSAVKNRKIFRTERRATRRVIKIIHAHVDLK